VGLDNVDLQVRQGEKVALVGHNGAGKSTLLLHLNGLLHGDGEVVVMGRRIDAHDRKALAEVRAKVGCVFQDADDQLFSPTLYDDVAFGPIYMGLSPQDVEQRTMDAIRAVGLAGKERRMPHHFSGGEKKRASIATVLSMQPDVLVLDEPSAGLDPRARRELIKLLNGLDHTIIATTHDMHLVRDLFPRMVVMDSGKIVADGPTAELLSNRGFLEEHGLELS
jgi:cobalt transport protein ATP-binding subunit